MTNDTRIPKLNEEAYRIIKLKEMDITNKGSTRPTRFSIVFMGDTHIGMRYCEIPPLKIPILQYEQLLNKIKVTKTGEILAIFHGGDATDYGERNLKLFIDKTWEVLYNSLSLDTNKIPLFLNAGNHEYNLSRDNTGEVIRGDLYSYHKLVEAEVLKFSKPPGQHPEVQVISLESLNLSVVLLNTGYGNKGTFGAEDRDNFDRQIKQIDKWMTYLEGINPNNKFIINMHIPPNIGRWGTKDENPYGDIPHKTDAHVLNDNYNELFTRYILDNHSQSLVSVVAHHRHCFIINPPQIPPLYYSEKYKLNFFLTPAGGNCDIDCGGKCNLICNGKYPYPYHALQLNYQYQNNKIVIDDSVPYQIIHL